MARSPLSHLILSLLLNHARFLDDADELGMLGNQLLVLILQPHELFGASLEVEFKRAFASDTSLLRQLLVLFVFLCPFVFGDGELGLDVVKSGVQLGKFLFILGVLSLNELHFLTSVRQHDNLVDDLAAKTGQLLVPLLNLLVKGLVLDLELLVIDQVETFRELLLFLQDFLLVGQTVPQSDVLKTILVDLLILRFVSILPVFDDLGAEFLASSAVNGVHGHTALQLLELLLNLGALSLLLVEFALEFASHAVVPILSLLQVVADLVHVGQRVQILVLVEHLVTLLFVVTGVRVHQNDLLLAVFVQLLELLVLTTFVLDSLNELAFHGGLTRQLTKTIVGLLLLLVFAVHGRVVFRANI